MKKIAAVLCVFFSIGGGALAQTSHKTVTNRDLEKFTQKRVEAEREYRETYAAKGLLSPQELSAQNDARIKATLELADKIRAADAERERLAAAAIAQQQAAPRIIVNSYPSGSYGYPSGYYDSGIVYSYGYDGYYDGYYGRRARGRFGRFYRPPLSGGYAAGGWVWPAPVGASTFQRPRPMFNIRSPRSHR